MLRMKRTLLATLSPVSAGIDAIVVVVAKGANTDINYKRTAVNMVIKVLLK